jgi:hypothetical protein
VRSGRDSHFAHALRMPLTYEDFGRIPTSIRPISIYASRASHASGMRRATVLRTASSAASSARPSMRERSPWSTPRLASIFISTKWASGTTRIPFASGRACITASLAHCASVQSKSSGGKSGKVQVSPDSASCEAGNARSPLFFAPRSRKRSRTALIESTRMRTSISCVCGAPVGSLPLRPLRRRHTVHRRIFSRLEARRGSSSGS